jgi:hypothetical protein
MTPLEKIWHDIHDPTTWPAPPTPELQFTTAADWARVLPTEADWARWGWRPRDEAAVDGDRQADRGRARRV